MKPQVTQYFPDGTTVFLCTTGEEVARINPDGTFSIGTQIASQECSDAIDEAMEEK